MSGVSITFIARVFIDGVQTHEERLTVTPENMVQKAQALARQHFAGLPWDKPHMVEFEFLDAPPGIPDDERFFRIGTDPRAMRHPVEVGTVHFAKTRENIH